MLPSNQKYVQHKHPYYNYPSVVSQSPSPTPTDPSMYNQHAFSQISSCSQYLHPPQHDHMYSKSYSPMHVQSSVHPHDYSQHVGAPGSPVLSSYPGYYHGYSPVQHASNPSPSLSHHSLQNGASTSPVAQAVSNNVSPSMSSQPDSSGSPFPPTFPTQLPYNVNASNVSNTQITSSSASEGESGFTTVYNKKTRRRDHSVSSSGSNQTVTSRSSKRAKPSQKSPNLTKPRTKSQHVNQHIPLANKFSVLNPSTAENLSQDEDISESEAPKIKIPPIFISKKSVTVGELLKSLKTLNPDFSLKDSKDSLRLECGTIDVYRSFCSLLDKKNIQYHSYRLPEDKTIDVVVKHVPTDFSDQEITEELQSLGFTDFKLMRVWDKDKKPIPVVSLYLNSSHQKNKDIYSLDKLLNCVVLVEPKRRSRNIPQCMNCQRYGHTKNYCKLSPRCMFCSADHPSAQCTNMEEAIKVCVNCGENHSANYKGCQYYAELKKKRFRPDPYFQIPQRPSHHSNVPPDISEFPPMPQNQPSSRPAFQVGDHSYAEMARTSSFVQPNYTPLTSSQFSSAIPSTPNENTTPVMDSLVETLWTAFQPFLVTLIEKIKPLLQGLLIQCLHGLR